MSMMQRKYHEMQPVTIPTGPTPPRIYYLYQCGGCGKRLWMVSEMPEDLVPHDKEKAVTCRGRRELVYQTTDVNQTDSTTLEGELG